MIVKDEVDAINELVGEDSNAPLVFEKIFLTISDKNAYNKLSKLLTDKVYELDYRPWNDRFDEARQHNWEKGKDMDASFWLDADDKFDFKQINQLYPYLEEYDAIFLPYHYEHDDNGNVIVKHWRERLVSRRIPFYWKGWVHENLISDDTSFKIKHIDIPIIHNKRESKEASAERNHKILLKAYQETQDPRYIHYLGISFFTLHEYQKAIDILKEYCEVGGWDEEIYRSIVKIAEAYHMLGDHEQAVNYCLKAASVIPEYPMAYEVLAHIEFQAENYKQALEWVKTAARKDVPLGASIYDPTSRDRNILTGALCEMQLGNSTEAVQLLQKVKTVDVSDILPLAQEEANVERLQEVLPQLIDFYKEPKAIWDNLRDDLKWKPELRKLREAVTKPKKWADNTIVFFCGKGYEEWGPHTLDKGMGGSEEAVVYLSRELAKLGYQVTVYGEVSGDGYFEQMWDDGTWSVEEMTATAPYVDYQPWTRIDRRDEFNTLVIWRAPQFATQFKAKNLLIDMHDVLPKDIVKPYKNAHYMFKSQYHKDLYPDIENYSIIGNGIDPSQFTPREKKPYSVIYPSAYYRGLETLLSMWEDIRKEVPEATLDIYYGWESWVAYQGEDDFYNRIVDKLDALKDQGVTEHGRVDHKTLADKFEESKVWAYPTEFPEIHCITALKANMAGCKPVITDVAALKETGGPNATFIETDKIYTDQYNRNKFVKAVVKALKEDHDTIEQMEFAKQHSWESVAKEWERTING